MPASVQKQDCRTAVTYKSIPSLHHQQVSAAGMALLADDSKVRVCTPFPGRATKGDDAVLVFSIARVQAGKVLVVLANGKWMEPTAVHLRPSSRTCPEPSPVHWNSDVCAPG